ncbi:uncharacterized protein BDW43DRAFT_303057 [Aspergillus alliaceus]|uniref:uncharacterized protein n=1 Tax=Petromyces alliaceus TaxID=209559 RepID=UPI0012A4FE3E|nr:uncharacterized protein BDW43DRAFT_303057 [Aspergillus alliaceus]KAB8229466.1 hypothetical protein BDW43DRAFT_303057 [Aspergillus alliaceus]
MLCGIARGNRSIDGTFESCVLYNNVRLRAPISPPRARAPETNPRTGYRPINGSVRLCVDSLRSIHNETVNVYSHLVPATIALSNNGFLHQYFRGRYPTASLVGQLALYVYLTTSVLCLGTLSIYHTLLCHSEAYSDLWGCLDYVAIILQTIGSFVSGIYAIVVILVSPRFQSSRWRMLRLSMFVATDLSGLLPIIHAASIYPYARLNQQAGLGHYLVEGLTLIIGVVFYAFDIWGASHQIFHLFVLLSAAIHVWGILRVFDLIYKNPRC